jgi:hypothetical protein
MGGASHVRSRSALNQVGAACMVEERAAAGFMKPYLGYDGDTTM